jgi:hypothetical protein
MTSPKAARQEDHVTIKSITAPSDDGVVEATRDSKGVWDINYPWFTERFVGSPTEVRARIRRTVKNRASNRRKQKTNDS